MPLPRLKLINENPKRPAVIALEKMEQLLERPEGVWREGEIIHLDGWRTIKYKESSDQINVIAELVSATVCASCGATAARLKKNGLTGPRHVRDVPFHFKPVTIHYRAQRYLCRRCKTSVQQPAPGIHQAHLMTERLVYHLAAKGFDLRSNFAGISRETGVSDRTIRQIFTNCAVNLEQNAVIETPSWLSIDEVYPSRNQRECTAVTDPVEKKVVNLIKRDKIDNFERWLRQLPKSEKVEVVTIDFWPAYRATVKRVLPAAAIVVDRFHVQNLLSKALIEALAVIRDRLSVTDRKEYLRRRSLVLKSRHHLSETRRGHELLSEVEAVETSLQQLPALAVAYELKEEFADILQLGSRETAEERADAWLEKIANLVVYLGEKYKNQCRRLNKYPFKSVIETFTEWRTEILNYIDYRDRFPLKATNAFAEMANGKIKEANRLGKGYNFEVLRMKLLYGALLVGQVSPHFASEHEFHQAQQPPTSNPESDGSQSNRSNLARLEAARESRDEIKKLIVNPRENADWSIRFADANQITDGTVKNETLPRAKSKRVRQTDSFDEGQLNLFSKCKK